MRIPPDSVPILGQGAAMSPVDIPLPSLVIRAHSFRALPGAPNEFILKFTPVTLVGPNTYAPSGEHHYEVVFNEGSVNAPGGLLAQLAAAMTPDQRAAAAIHFAEPE